MSDVDFLELTLRAYRTSAIIYVEADPSHSSFDKSALEFNHCTYRGDNFAEIISILKDDYARCWLSHLIEKNLESQKP